MIKHINSQLGLGAISLGLSLVALGLGLTAMLGVVGKTKKLKS